ncbi:MAG: 30S ribosomal protein S8 [Candidatus Diapherotrites archaeon]|nr:30S ribosomal protein S8 [Candidatus Diapherotrites archaeon]
MSLMDPIADALVQIKNAEDASKKECAIQHGSNFLGEVLNTMKENEYIESYEKKVEGSIITYSVKLGGKINECKAIKPRYAVKKDAYEKYEKRYLPARDIGLLIVSTSQGVMSHTQAKSKGLGGRLVAFVY